MVPVSQPISEQLPLFGRSWIRGNAHHQRGNSVTDEVALVAADKDVSLRLWIGLNADAVSLSHLANFIAEIGFSQSPHREQLREFSASVRRSEAVALG